MSTVRIVPANFGRNICCCALVLLMYPYPCIGAFEMANAGQGDMTKFGNEATRAGEAFADKAKTAYAAATAAADQTRAKAEDLGEQAWEISQRVGSQAKDVADEVSQQGGRVIQSLSRQIEAQPLLGVLAAAGIGYLLGYVSNRR